VNKDYYNVDIRGVCEQQLVRNYKRGIEAVLLYSEKVLMCEAGVTNAEPSEDDSISAVKVTQIQIAQNGVCEYNLLDVHPSHSACQSL